MVQDRLPANTASEVSRYEMVESVGRGAMGEVFKAFDPALGRHVALKFLRSGTPQEVRGILREARAMARVDHRHVCKVFETGMANGRAFLAMQFVDGLTLDKAKDHLSITQKVEVIRDVADAVQAAHTDGIIHRDIKPSNIMVEFKDDGSLKTWVMDFGVARFLAADQTVESNQFSGTPLYMAPEQLKSHHQMDRRADVYSLGATLYELLCGRPPFTGSSSVNVIVQIINDDPRPLRRQASNVPRDLETITMKCLAKQAHHRYRSAKELVSDLDRFLEGKPIEAHPPSVLYRVTKTIKRNKAIYVALIVSTVTLTILTSWAIRERRRSAHKVYLAQEFSRQAQAIENYMQLVYTMPPHDVTSALNGVALDIAKIERRMDELGNLARGPGHYAIGRALMVVSDFEGAFTHLQNALQAGIQTPDLYASLGHVLVELYERESNRANRLILDRRFREQRLSELQNEYLNPARDHLSRAGLDAQNNYALALLDLLQDDPEKALQSVQEVYARQPWNADGYIMHARILCDLAIESEDQGDYQRALSLYDEAIAITDNGLRIVSSHPRLYSERDALKQFRFGMLVEERAGNDRESFDDLMLSLRQSLEVDPNNIDTYISMTWTLKEWAYHESERGRSAQEPADGAVEMGRKAVGLDPRANAAKKALALALLNRGYINEQSGLDPLPDYQESMIHMQDAIDLSPRDTNALNGMGSVLHYQAYYLKVQGKENRAILQRSIDFYEQAIDVNPNFAYAHNNISIPCLQLARTISDGGGDPSEILQKSRHHLNRAIELNPNYYNAHLNLAVSYWQHGIYLQEQGQDPRDYYDRSIASSERAIGINPENRRGLFTCSNVHAAIAEYLIKRGGEPATHLKTSRELIQMALDTTPGAHFSYNNFAHIYLLESTYLLNRGLDPLTPLKKAIDLLGQAIQSNPNRAMPYANLGYAYRDQAIYAMRTGSDPEPLIHESLANFQKGLKLNQAYINGYVGRARLYNAWIKWRVSRHHTVDSLIEAAQTDIQEALNLNPMDAHAHLEASKLELIRARLVSNGDKEKVLAHLQTARKHAESAVALSVNDSENLLQLAATVRHFIELQELTPDESIALTESASSYVNQARAQTEFQAWCDLEEAHLRTANGEREHALSLAQSAFEAGGHLAKEAASLIERLNLMIQ